MKDNVINFQERLDRMREMRTKFLEEEVTIEYELNDLTEEEYEELIQIIEIHAILDTALLFLVDKDMLTVDNLQKIYEILEDDYIE